MKVSLNLFMRVNGKFNNSQSPTPLELAFSCILFSVRTQYLKEKNTIENVYTISLQLSKVHSFLRTIGNCINYVSEDMPITNSRYIIIRGDLPV